VAVDSKLSSKYESHESHRSVLQSPTTIGAGE